MNKLFLRLPSRRRVFGSGGALIGALVIGLGGCVAHRPSESVKVERPVVSGSDYRATFEAGVATLRDAGFRVGRQDYRFGRIQTEPKGSPTAFEPWKPDNTEATQAWRSTLDDLRRTVTVSLTPHTTEAQTIASAEGAVPQRTAPYRLQVEVQLERRQVPERRLDGRTQGSVFSNLAEVPDELVQRGVGERRWRPIGRDTALERELTRQILDRQNKPAPH